MSLDIERGLRHLFSRSEPTSVRRPDGIALSGLCAHRRRQPACDAGGVHAQSGADFALRRAAEILDGRPGRQAAPDRRGRTGSLYPQTEVERFPQPSVQCGERKSDDADSRTGVRYRDGRERVVLLPRRRSGLHRQTFRRQAGRYEATQGGFRVAGRTDRTERRPELQIRCADLRRVRRPDSQRC